MLMGHSVYLVYKMNLSNSALPPQVLMPTVLRMPTLDNLIASSHTDELAAHPVKTIKRSALKLHRLKQYELRSTIVLGQPDPMLHIMVTAPRVQPPDSLLLATMPTILPFFFPVIPSATAHY